MKYMNFYDLGTSLLVGIAMVETLTSKTTAWEKENGVYFTYDGVSALAYEYVELSISVLKFIFNSSNLYTLS